jgi:hypothetical protein
MNIVMNFKIMLNTVLTTLLINVVLVGAFMFSDTSALVVSEFLMMFLAFLISINFTTEPTKRSYSSRNSEVAILDALN